MGAYTTIAPVVSKIFCSSSHAVLMVRRRPRTVNGGGLVVTSQDQRAAFSVDGCGIIGASGQLIVRNGDGSAILFIHKKVKIQELGWKLLLCFLNVSIKLPVSFLNATKSHRKVSFKRWVSTTGGEDICPTMVNRASWFSACRILSLSSAWRVMSGSPWNPTGERGTGTTRWLDPLLRDLVPSRTEQARL